MNYYEILGIPKTATEDEIKKAYRTLAKQYHPDRNPGDKDAEEKFKRVQEAYDTLSDASKRRDYDYMGQGTDELEDNFSYFGGRSPFDSYDEYFQNIFGNRPTEGEHGDHIIIQVKTDLEGVLKGSKLDIEFSRKELCEDCGGRGGVLDTCRQCNGTGWYVIRGKNAAVKRSCPNCGGGGKSVTNECKDCNGTGFGGSVTDRLVSVIPPGVVTGKQFVFKGRGNPGRNGGRPGNVFVVVTVAEHELFKRQDWNLHCEVPVTYTQLVLGDEIEIPTLDHKKLGFRIPPGTQSGTKFRLQKQGLPKRIIHDEDVKPQDLGDMYVEVKLETPVNIKEEQIEAMEKLAKYDESDHYPLKKEYEKKKERILNECPA
jgi:molecular chaperone DnaJ